jgi:hypothetical protein
LKPISAKIILRRFDERMAFVQEGQADSSQARSAWVCSLDIWKGALGMIYAPKVATGLSPGVSTLGTLKINEFALKGREADLIKPAPIAVPKIRGRN